MNSFLDVIKSRRSYYDITNKSSISDEAIENILKNALLHVPSAYNSHMAKATLLLGKHHKRLWEIVELELEKIVPEKKLSSTKAKIATFSAGYGSILYFNDRHILKELQEKMPLYKDDFALYAEHGVGMLQFAVWCMLKDAGMGASLQHYGNLIEHQVQKEWGIPNNYKLVAQMPFGIPNTEPFKKEFPEVDTLFSKFV